MFDLFFCRPTQRIALDENRLVVFNQGIALGSKSLGVISKHLIDRFDTPRTFSEILSYNSNVHEVNLAIGRYNRKISSSCLLNLIDRIVRFISCSRWSLCYSTLQSKNLPNTNIIQNNIFTFGQVQTLLDIVMNHQGEALLSPVTLFSLAIPHWNRLNAEKQQYIFSQLEPETLVPLVVPHWNLLNAGQRQYIFSRVSVLDTTLLIEKNDKGTLKQLYRFLLTNPNPSNERILNHFFNLLTATPSFWVVSTVIAEIVILECEKPLLKAILKHSGKLLEISSHVDGLSEPLQKKYHELSGGDSLASSKLVGNAWTTHLATITKLDLLYLYEKHLELNQQRADFQKKRSDLKEKLLKDLTALMDLDLIRVLKLFEKEMSLGDNKFYDFAADVLCEAMKRFNGLPIHQKNEFKECINRIVPYTKKQLQERTNTHNAVKLYNQMIQIPDFSGGALQIQLLEYLLEHIRYVDQPTKVKAKIIVEAFKKVKLNDDCMKPVMQAFFNFINDFSDEEKKILCAIMNEVCSDEEKWKNLIGDGYNLSYFTNIYAILLKYAPLDFPKLHESLFHRLSHADLDSKPPVEFGSIIAILLMEGKIESPRKAFFASEAFWNSLIVNLERLNYQDVLNLMDILNIRFQAELTPDELSSLKRVHEYLQYSLSSDENKIRALVGLNPETLLQALLNGSNQRFCSLVLFEVLKGFERLSSNSKEKIVELLDKLSTEENHPIWEHLKTNLPKTTLLELYRSTAQGETAIKTKLRSLLDFNAIIESSLATHQDLLFSIIKAEHASPFLKHSTDIWINLIKQFSHLKPENKKLLIFVINWLPEDIWIKIANSCAAQLKPVYEFLLQNHPNEYSMLRDKLFAIFIKSGFPMDENFIQHVAIQEYQVPERQAQFQNSDQGIIALSILIREKPEWFSDKPYQFVLEKLLDLFLKNKENKFALERFIQFLGINKMLQPVWVATSEPLRRKVLIALEASKANDAVTKAIYQAYAEELRTLSEKEFDAKPAEELKAFFNLMLHLKETPPNSPLVLQSLLEHLCDVPKMDDEVYKNVISVLLKANNFKPKYRTFLHFLWIHQDRWMEKNKYPNRFPIYIGQFPFRKDLLDYISSLNAKVEDDFSHLIFSAFYRDFPNLSPKEKDLFFKLVAKWNRLDVLQPHMRNELLQSLARSHITNFKELKSLLNWAFPNKEKTEPLLILKILACQNIKDGKEYEDFLIKGLTKEQFQEVFQYLTQFDFNSAKEIDPSITAIFVCSIAHGQGETKGQESEEIKSLLSRVNMHRLSDELFMRKICKGVLSSIVEKNPDQYLRTTTETQRELYYRPKETAMEAHLLHTDATYRTSAAVPEPPKEPVDCQELVTMFNGLNFTDPSKPHYVSPNDIKDDGGVITREIAASGIQSYVDKVKKVPSFAPKDPTEQAKFMATLQSWVKHSILLLRKRGKDQARFLLEFAGKGLHCGGAVYTAAQDLYAQLSGTASNSSDDVSVAEFVAQHTAQLRLGLFDEEFTKYMAQPMQAGYRQDGQSTHLKAHAMRIIGKRLNIYGWQAYDYADELVANWLEIKRQRPNFVLPSLCTEQGLNQLHRSIMARYDATAIINRLDREINGTAHQKASISADFRRQVLDPWFKNNMPIKFRSEFLEKRKEHIKSDKEREKIKAAVKEKWVAKSFKDLVELTYCSYKRGRLLHRYCDGIVKVINSLESQKLSRQALIERVAASFTNDDQKELALKQLEKTYPHQKKEDVLTKQYDRMYEDELLDLENYAGEVCSEIYYLDMDTGQQVLKREWIIHMLKYISIEDDHNVLENEDQFPLCEQPTNPVDPFATHVAYNATRQRERVLQHQTNYWNYEAK